MAKACPRTDRLVRAAHVPVLRRRPWASPRWAPLLLRWYSSGLSSVLSSSSSASDCEDPLCLDENCWSVVGDLMCAQDLAQNSIAGVVASRRIGARGAIRAGDRGMDY